MIHSGKPGVSIDCTPGATEGFSSGIELSVIDSHDVNEIERGLAVFGHEPNGEPRAGAYGQ